MDEPPNKEESESVEHHHRNVQAGGARAAVFGVSDGLVTNVSLILGVAAAQPGAGIVRLTGLAGLVAGAFSMAAGEFVSMQAQRELLERELDVERLARELVEEMMSDPELALETHAREELGINPSALGSPVQAAAASFVAFGIGALLPLLPWFFASGTTAVLGSVVIGVVASLTVGWALGVFTGRSRLRSALRQLVVAVVASSVTYGIGRAVGAGVQ